jgi:serine/threonine protein kinase
MIICLVVFHHRSIMMLKFILIGDCKLFNISSKPPHIAHLYNRTNPTAVHSAIYKIVKSLIIKMFRIHDHNIIHHDIKPHNIVLDIDVNALTQTRIQQVYILLLLLLYIYIYIYISVHLYNYISMFFFLCFILSLCVSNMHDDLFGFVSI